MQMGRGEELGSGVLNVNRYLPFYTKNGKPRFVEGDPFVTTIPLPGEIEGGNGERSSVKSSVKTLELIGTNPETTAREIARVLGLTLRAVEKQLSKLQEAGRLRRIGPDKGGHWEVVARE